MTNGERYSDRSQIVKAAELPLIVTADISENRYFNRYIRILFVFYRIT